MTEFTVETPAFRQALATALAFACTDAVYPMLNQVHVKPVESGIEIAASDRYVLSVEELNVTGEPFEIDIPYDVAKRLLSLLPKPSRKATVIGGMTEIAKEGDKVTVRIIGEYETAVTFTPPSDEKFVNYRELIDKTKANKKSPAAEMAFGPLILTRVCRALLARNRHDPLKFHFGGDTQAVFVQQGTLTVLVMPVRIHEPATAKPSEVAA
jgi:DNA polymerase III sliding clamp (beta) subunit (PCNA family)